MPFRYTQSFFSILSEEQTKVILAVLEEAGLQIFVQKYPFRSLEFRSDVQLKARVVQGFYSYQTQDAKINVDRDITDFAVVYKQQDFWSISSLAKTPIGAIRGTLIHETGHHLHNHLKSLNPSVFRHTMLMPRSSALSQYGTQNNPEYFAETFAAYVFLRTELLVQDKLGYDMMNLALNALELQVKEIL